MPDVCLSVDPRTGIVVDCNPALTRLLSHESEDVIGRHVSVLAGDGELSHAGAAWRAIACGSELVDVDIRVKTKGGDTLEMSASARTMPTTAAMRALSLHVWRDVSRRRQSELSLQQSADHLRALAYELTVAESRERERIAGGLHDEIGQLLAVATLKLGELGQAAEPEARAVLIADVRALIVQASRATRSATFELSCPVLQQLGLPAAIDSLGQRMERIYGLRVHAENQTPPPSLPQSATAIVFRVVRELLANVQKHARARNAWVTSVRQNDQLTVRVRDDGMGFDVPPLPRSFGPEGGFGLVSADAQIQAIGGRLEIRSTRGAGTHATLTVPCIGG